MNINAQNKDSEGHSLVSLWKSYNKAVDADKPADAAKVLLDIKKEALAKGLAWDFYDAARSYVRVKASINWKDRETLEAALDREVTESGMPVMQFFHRHGGWSVEEAEAFVKENEAALKASHNREFYAQDYAITGSACGEALPDILASDYDYALYSTHCSRGSDLARKHFAGSYPLEALASYEDACRLPSEEQTAALEAFARQYDGKAVALPARLNLLQRSFRKNEEDKAGESSYLSLKSLCEAYNRDRNALGGSEKALAQAVDSADGLLETLKGSDISVEVRNSEARLLVRNCQSVKFRLTKEGRTIHETSLRNSRNSFYVQDELSCRLPALDDGEYVIECSGSGAECSVQYEKYTISIALRASADGKEAYVADHITGEPLKTCGFMLLDEQYGMLASCDGVKISGFTQLPAVVASAPSGKRWTYIQAVQKDASGMTRLSRPVSMNTVGFVSSGVRTDDALKCSLITDRRAFNPGEKVCFKAILFKGTHSYRVLDAGVKVLVRLTDNSGKTVSEQTLTTNEFGSVAGEFALPAQEKAGRMCLNVLVDGKLLSNEAITVDEFVLPSFAVSWDEDNRIHFCGDLVSLGGRVKAYSGHSLSSATAVVRISRDRRTPLEEKAVKLSADGSFSVEFQTGPDATAYTAELTVTDATGETISASRHLMVFPFMTLDLTALNTEEGVLNLTDSGNDACWTVTEDELRIRTAVSSALSRGPSYREGLEISYQLFDGAGSMSSGSLGAGGEAAISLKGLKSGLYTLKVRATAHDASGKEIVAEQRAAVLRISSSDKSLNADVKSFVRVLPGNDVAVQIGSTQGPVWAVVELFGTGNVVLERRLVKLSGQKGRAGSLETVSFKRKASWPQTLSLKVFWFRDSSSFQYSWNVPLAADVFDFPLRFTRFLDTTAPGRSYSFSLSCLPGVECAATIFDTSTETIASNTWRAVAPQALPYPSIRFTVASGAEESRQTYMVGTSFKAKSAVRIRGAANAVHMDAEMAVLEDAAPLAVQPAEAEVHVRENFASTIAWEPFLRSDKDGNIEFSFTNSDKLSTYAVQIMAHDKDFHNAVLRRNMLVTIPVKIAVVQPQSICRGDIYVVRTTLSNNTASAISGKLRMQVLDGRDRLTATVLSDSGSRITVPAAGSSASATEITVPAGIKDMGLLISFIPDSETQGSDAVFVSIPVKDGVQTITEAHSALLKAGMDQDALVAGLRSQFTGVAGSQAAVRRISILDMLNEAVPERVEAASDNVISLTEALYANCLVGRLRGTALPDGAMALLPKIKACQNGDGGFAWFEGMKSSPVVTALVLQRIKAMDEPDFASAGIKVEPAVQYLDRQYFSTALPLWCGGLSLEQYLHVRSLFAGVAFDSGVAGRDALRKFRKSCKDYLVPSGKRGMNGMVLSKARRLLTLSNLAASDAGRALARQWGIGNVGRVTRSMAADLESLKQYAVEHVSGGYYVPNAVMPFRGLLESELYAHALLCQLFQGSELAEGIRLWIMVQKETQNWGSDPAYLEAIAAVMQGSEQTLQTSVIALSASYTSEYEDIKAAGNGFTVERRWFIGERELADGDILHLGDRVRAEYRIWNQENRSFVRLTAPRAACMRPVDQLSGPYGWRFSPLRVNGYWNISPQGHRSVRADRSEYWFDSYPEEKTTVTEEFFVTQEGRFRSPVLEIESLYAPHYRANDCGHPAVCVQVDNQSGN